MKGIFLATIFILMILLTPSLGYEVKLITPEFVQPNETFKVSFELFNASDIAGFQIDIFTNAQILKVEKGQSIQHWSIFTYKIDNGSARIIAARYKEDVIDSGVLVVLTLRSKGDVVSLRYEGLLVNSGGEKVGKFSGEVSLSKPVTTTTTVYTQPTPEGSMEMTNVVWILQNKMVLVVIAAIIVGLIIWKLKFS